MKFFVGKYVDICETVRTNGYNRTFFFDQFFIITQPSMKTLFYNPSTLEVAFADVIGSLQDEIQQKLPEYVITKVDHNLKLDNPRLTFTVEDPDGDRHEILLQFIQRIDA